MIERVTFHSPPDVRVEKHINLHAPSLPNPSHAHPERCLLMMEAFIQAVGLGRPDPDRILR